MDESASRANRPTRLRSSSNQLVLALLAAGRDIGIAKVSLLEPTLGVKESPPFPSGMSAEVAKLIITGHRGEAYEHWMRGASGCRPK